VDTPVKSRWPRVVVGVLLLAAIVVLLVSGGIGSWSPAEIKSQLLASGAWGPILFVLAFGLLQPLGLSAHVFIVAAALVWSPPVGLLLSWLGILLGSTAAFVFARWMGRDWVQKRLPARLRRWDDALAKHEFRTVLVLRLLLFTFGPMQLMLGVSTVRYVPFLAATAIGVLPMVALESFVGAGLVEWLFRSTG
jgi:uncharacterized membrane protein YdjX (TVP38/TMEM64 family)